MMLTGAATGGGAGAARCPPTGGADGTGTAGGAAHGTAGGYGSEHPHPDVTGSHASAHLCNTAASHLRLVSGGALFDSTTNSLFYCC